MELLYLREKEDIKLGIQELTNIFIDEYPYYSTWIQKKQAEFDSFEKEVVAITENQSIVGYAMIHHCDSEYFKINGIYVFPQFEGKGFASRCIEQMINDARITNAKYALIQTRFHNNTVTHMFDKLGFSILGNNYHEIEKNDNWVAVCDIQGNGNKNEMLSVVKNEYPGFIQMTEEEIKTTRVNYETKSATVLKKKLDI